MVTCDICGRTFKNEHGLHIHQGRVHKDLANRLHESSSANVLHDSACAKVPQESTRAQNVPPNKFSEETRTPTDRKIQTNEKKSSQTDSSKQGLEKPCKCTQCEKAFETERGLKIHMTRTHKTKQGVTSEKSPKQESLKQDRHQHQSHTISTPQRNVGRSVEIDSVNNEGMSVDNDSGNNIEIDVTSIVKRQDSSRNYVDKPEAADCQKTFTCIQCGGAFRTERGLKIHVSKMHKSKQGVAAENSNKRQALKQDSNPNQSQTIISQQGRVVSSVETDSGNTADGSVDNYSGNSTESLVGTDSGNSTETSVETDRGNSPESSVDHDSGISTERSVDTYHGNSSESSVDDGGNSPERSVDNYSGNSPERSVDNDGGYSTERSVDNDGESYDLELPDVGDLCHQRKKGIKKHERDESLSTNVSAPPTYTPKTELSDVSDFCQQPNESVSVSAPPIDAKKKGPDKKLLEKVSNNKLNNEDVQETARVVNELMDDFMKELKNISPKTFGWNYFKSGSYYDKTKNSLPDEFDIMIYPKDLQVQVDFESITQVPGFYKVKLVSPRCEEINSMVDNDGYIKPAGFKHYVFGLFDEVRSTIRKGRRMIKKEMSNDDSPAYTFDYNTIPSRRIDIDLVPCFRISGWPPIAKLIDPTWLSQSKVVNDAVKCYDIVCKTCPEDVSDRDYLWRLSFSCAEKKLITYANDGNKCSNKKKAFKMIKSYIEEIKMKHPDRVKKFCSYHIKQFMLQQFDTWKESEFSSVLQRLVRLLINNLSSSPPHINNYFIENDNVIRLVPDSEIQLIVQGLRAIEHKTH